MITACFPFKDSKPILLRGIFYMPIRLFGTSTDFDPIDADFLLFFTCTMIVEPLHAFKLCL